MKFVCLGYYDPGHFAGLPESELQGMMENCHEYDDVLRRGGHFLGGEALQHPDGAVTVRHHEGGVDVCDGPYAETKEQIGGILLLEARDLNHAIALMSKHPAVVQGMSLFEIRPVDEEINRLVAERSAAFAARN